LPTLKYYMKKIGLAVTALLFLGAAFAQDNPAAKKKQINLNSRPNDHLMIQFSSDHWTNMPDSVSSHQKGFSRGFNAAFMIDKPFRNSPKFSVAFGLGFSSSNIFFKTMTVDIASTTAKLPFTATDATNHYKKFKVATSFLEVPVELRFSSRPDQNSKSVKFALGAKIGTLINAHIKGKDLEDNNNKVIRSSVVKETSKRFFNTTRLVTTARIGYGMYSIFGAYQVSKILKEAVGPDMKGFQIGIALSGL
jgi:hypothetical protein